MYLSVLLATLLAALWLVRRGTTSTEKAHEGARYSDALLNGNDAGGRGRRSPTDGHVARSLRPTRPRVPVARSNVFEPTSPDYDPILKAREESPRRVWEDEKRDPAWATKREQRLTSTLEDVLEGMPGNARATDIECRFSSCRVRVEIDQARIDDILGRYPVMMLAPLTGIEDVGPIQPRTTVPYYLVYPPDLREDEKFVEYLANAHEEAARTFKTAEEYEVEVE